MVMECPGREAVTIVPLILVIRYGLGSYRVENLLCFL